MMIVRLGEALSSQKNLTGDTFFATLDQPLVAGGFVIMNFIVDMLYAILDPRIRHGHA